MLGQSYFLNVSFVRILPLLATINQGRLCGVCLLLVTAFQGQLRKKRTSLVDLTKIRHP